MGERPWSVSAGRGVCGRAGSPEPAEESDGRAGTAEPASRRRAEPRVGADRGASQEPTAERRPEPTAEPTEEPRVLGQPRLLGQREFVPYDGPRYAPYDPELE